MIKYYFKSIKEKKLRTLDSFRPGAWVHAVAPSKDELEKLALMLDIEENLLHDGLDPYEVPRLESDNGTSCVYTRVPQSREYGIETVTLLIAVGKDFILTMSKDKLDLFDRFTRNQHQVFTTQKAKLFFELVASINHQYNSYLLDISKRVHTLHAKIERINNRDIANFVDYEKILNDFISGLVPTKSVLETLMGGRHINLYEEDKDMIEDLFLASGQLVEHSKSVLRYVVNIRDAYSSIMTHDLNRVMKLLTALTIILTVPTMIFSFYGMNVSLPLGTLPAAFAYIALATILISAGIFWLFTKKRWL